MYSMSFHILKGGVGKSSLSGNTAFLLGEKYKTVLIDCDIQGNSTHWFYEKNIEFELTDILQGEKTVKETIIHIRNNLYLIPTKKVDSKLKEYSETKLFQEPFIFEDLKSELKNEGFEFCIFDLSPSISQLERCVLLSLDEVVTPLTPEFFSYEGIKLFKSELEKINKNYRKYVKHNKIVINNINKSFSTHKEYLKQIEKLKEFYQLFFIPQDRKIADSQINNKSIFEIDKKSQACIEIEKIIGAIKCQ